MNQVSYNDFGLFETEKLSVDYICLNLPNLSNISQVASYFQALGFNCYQKDRQENKSRQEVNNKNKSQNKYELIFITHIPYWDGIQAHFIGFHANFFYKVIKAGQHFELKEFDAILSRIDLYYDRRNQSKDKIGSQEFINSSFCQFQISHSRKNLQVKKNKKGLVFKIGSRATQKHYRVYTKDNFLRFEFEIKGSLIKDLHQLVVNKGFKEFEQILSYQFFKHSFELFSQSSQPSHLDWLLNRLRIYKHRDQLLSHSVPSHYLTQITFKKFSDKSDFITFLQFIVYAQSLTYRTDSLGNTQYRCVQFPVQDFLKHTKRSKNYYQLDKLVRFFDQLQENSLIQFFTDDYYRGLVTIPEVNLYKDIHKYWIAEVWMAEELFYQPHPFLFTDYFRTKLTKYQFQVLFEIIQRYSFIDIRKEFHFQQLIHSYSTSINGKTKIKIKEHFIEYLQALEKQQKIRSEVLILPSNETHNIHQITYRHLNQNKTIVAFELIDIRFK